MKRPSLSKIKKFPDLLVESGSRPNEGGATGNRKNIIFYFVDFLKQTNSAKWQQFILSFIIFSCTWISFSQTVKVD